MGIIRKLFKGGGAAAVVASACVGYDAHRKRVYEDQSFSAALRHYLTTHSLAWFGFIAKKRLEVGTQNVAVSQEKFLLKQLRENQDTEYGRAYDFAQMKSVQDFLHSHPLTRYADYKPYVERMMGGEQAVLTKDQPVVFAVTSGTSGTASILPMVKKQREVFFIEGVSLLYRCMVEAYPDTRNLNKVLKLFYNPSWRSTPGGIKIGPNSSTPSESQNLLHIYSTPEPAFRILSEPEAQYVHLLFALKDRHLGMIEANFASLVFNAFRTLEDQLPALLSDIRTGTLNDRLDLEADVRASLEALLTPDPERASEIQEAFRTGSAGVARRIWPQLRVALATDSGTFTLYGNKLRESYLQGVPLYSPIYGATEGLIGVNIWPTALPSKYLLHPHAQFFEFIPVDMCGKDQPLTLLLHQVKQDQVYEVVITNPSCLYRYRLGDVVKVVGFHNQCPIVEFMYRQGQFLNVRGEKIPETLFYNALMATVAQWKDADMLDYCCTESVMLEDTKFTKFKTRLPCYHVFLELETGYGKAQIPTNQSRVLDTELGRRSYPYGSFRQKGSIGALQIHLVSSGTFQELREMTIRTSDASANQYKQPRVLRRKEDVEFMLSRVL